MREVAMRMLKSLSRSIMVCGPISTGGRGSVEANMAMFHKGICLLAKQGKVIFDQRPFEVPMRRFIAARKEPGYAHELLDEFYLLLFKSGLIKELHFLPGWEGSTGARWEHEQAPRHGMAVFYLPSTLLDSND